jgi:hypothetical protein
MKCKAATGLGAALRAAGIVLALACSTAGAAQPGAQDVREAVQWIQRTADNKGRPYAVVDKKQARLYVFDSGGRLAGISVALLGATPGDHIVPGVGERAQRGEVRADERTTPAGRFDAIPGRNLSGEHVVWADYASAFAIHRLRPGRAQAPRQQRMDTESPEDNRVSLGCVIVPVAFYKDVVQHVLGQGRSVVYVLPETRRFKDLFGQD